jgi:hypothetical protein
MSRLAFNWQARVLLAKAQAPLVSTSFPDLLTPKVGEALGQGVGHARGR